MKKVGIVINCFNDPKDMLNRVVRSAYEQDYPYLFIVCVDDGSAVPVSLALEFKYDEKRLQIIRIPHSERATAREIGIEALRSREVDFFLFIDSDMTLPEHLISSLVSLAEQHDCDGIVIPEKAYSVSSNFWTKVKVFERNLYQAGNKITRSSIEAARFGSLIAFRGLKRD